VKLSSQRAAVSCRLGFLLLAFLPRTVPFVFRAAFFEVGFFFAMGFFVPPGFFFGMRESLTLAHPANNTPSKIATITPRLTPGPHRSQVHLETEAERARRQEFAYAVIRRPDKHRSPLNRIRVDPIHFTALQDRTMPSFGGTEGQD